LNEIAGGGLSRYVLGSNRFASPKRRLAENSIHRSPLLVRLTFFVFGLNDFLRFILQPAPSNPLAVQFYVAASASHYMAVAFLAQIIGGVLKLRSSAGVSLEVSVRDKQ
jgi:hypothetical protein